MSTLCDRSGIALSESDQEEIRESVRVGVKRSDIRATRGISRRTLRLVLKGSS